VLDVAFQPDRVGPQPLYQQLGGYLSDLIETERLPAGSKLPATRELAGALGLSRNTVSLAYEELVARGLLTAHVGQGTFVAARPATPRRAPAPSRGFAWSALYALRTRALVLPPGLTARPRGPVRYDFRGGQVDLGSLPAAELRRAFGGVLARHARQMAAHVDPLGWPPLRAAVAQYLVGRGIGCDAGDVAIVNGAQQAIDLVARVLLDPGDTVVMEQPGYFGASLAFAAAQANLVAVAVDDEGLRTDALARVLRARRVKLVYTTPAAQSPTGVQLSDARRRALLALADEHQAPIFEDDYDSELRYEGAPVPALKTLDGAGQVIYAGTFSKVLFPGLRVGYVVAARPLLEKLALARWNADVVTSVAAQAALAEVLAGGGLDRHLRRMRRIYGERAAAMQAALAASMPAGTRWTRPRGGHTVWLTLPDGTDAERVAHAAALCGIAYTPGSVFHWDGGGGASLALSFANLAPGAIREGIGRLGAIVRGAPVPRRRRSAR
jgi:GntR family transcriptional regulator/MocR family aminotransferase